MTKLPIVLMHALVLLQHEVHHLLSLPTICASDQQICDNQGLPHLSALDHPLAIGRTLDSCESCRPVAHRCDNLGIGRLEGIHLQQAACQVGADISEQAGEQQVSWKYTYMAHTCQSALVMLQLHANCI